jgi:hypothetical protein
MDLNLYSGSGYEKHGYKKIPFTFYVEKNEQKKFTYSSDLEIDCRIIKNFGDIKNLLLSPPNDVQTLPPYYKLKAGEEGEPRLGDAIAPTLVKCKNENCPEIKIYEEFTMLEQITILNGVKDKTGNKLYAKELNSRAKNIQKITYFTEDMKLYLLLSLHFGSDGKSDVNNSWVMYPSGECK